MKTTIALFLLSAVSSSNVLSITASSNNADELNFNLRHTANIKLLEGAQNKHQCHNHCERHPGKSKQWIDDCEEKCDRQYDQCYSLGDECETDDDCLTGGFNPCNKCGTSHGTEYYQRCYAEPVETPAPTPAPYEQPQCYNLGDECETDDDCMTGGFNPCNKCGTTHGTLYFQKCYGGDDEDAVLIESEEDRDKVNWDKAGNWTRKAAEKTVDGTKKAAQKTAEGTKKAAEATKDWGKRTFTDDNSGYSFQKPSMVVVTAAVATFMLV